MNIENKNEAELLNLPEMAKEAKKALLAAAYIYNYQTKQGIDYMNDFRGIYESIDKRAIAAFLSDVRHEDYGVKNIYELPEVLMMALRDDKDSIVGNALKRAMDSAVEKDKEGEVIPMKPEVHEDQAAEMAMVSGDTVGTVTELPSKKADEGVATESQEPAQVLDFKKAQDRLTESLGVRSGVEEALEIGEKEEEAPLPGISRLSDRRKKESGQIPNDIA